MIHKDHEIKADASVLFDLDANGDITGTGSDPLILGYYWIDTRDGETSDNFHDVEQVTEAINARMGGAAS